jgi:cyanophycin synthetase
MIGKFVDQMSVSGKKLAVVTFPGDRTNALIEESVKLLPSHFTHFICKQDDNRRGRKDGEVPELIRELLIKHGANPANVEVVLDEQDAINKALSTAHEGDFIVVLADKVSRCWKQITSYKSDGNTRVKEVDTRAEDHLLDRVEVDLISDAINNATIRTDKRGVIIEVEEENND